MCVPRFKRRAGYCRVFLLSAAGAETQSALNYICAADSVIYRERREPFWKGGKCLWTRLEVDRYGKSVLSAVRPEGRKLRLLCFIFIYIIFVLNFKECSGKNNECDINNGVVEV